MYRPSDLFPHSQKAFEPVQQATRVSADSAGGAHELPADFTGMASTKTKLPYEKDITLDPTKNPMFSQLYTTPLFVQPANHYGISGSTPGYGQHPGGKECCPSSQIVWNDGRLKFPRSELLVHQKVPLAFNP